jgi:hypothetical protein
LASEAMSIPAAATASRSILANICIFKRKFIRIPRLYPEGLAQLDFTVGETMSDPRRSG